MKGEPHKIAHHFFASLMQNQCSVCWKLFSKKSQDKFLQWALKDIYARNKKAAEFANLGLTEVRMMFENNDTGIMKSFWKRFFFSSNANFLYRFGYFDTVKKEGNKAMVICTMKFPDGRQAQMELLMLNERGGWKLAYVEKGLPF